jgi:hypothetical protein
VTGPPPGSLRLVDSRRFDGSDNHLVRYRVEGEPTGS